MFWELNNMQAFTESYLIFKQIVELNINTVRFRVIKINTRHYN